MAVPGRIYNMLLRFLQLSSPQLVLFLQYFGGSYSVSVGGILCSSSANFQHAH